MNIAQGNKDSLLLPAYLLSGFVALGCQVLWTRLLSLSFGSEVIGVTAIFVGYFLGVAIGAYCLNNWTIKAKNPLMLFGIFIIGLSAFAVASPALLAFLAKEGAEAIGAVTGLSYSWMSFVPSTLVAGLVLLPGTICIGGIFAALAAARRRAVYCRTTEGGLARLYATNTFGAVLGVICVTYFIIPATGFICTSIILACIGLSVAIPTLIWGVGEYTLPITDEKVTSIESIGNMTSEDRRLYCLLFVTGMIGVGFEIVIIHIMTQVLENTVYTYANISASYLLGTSIGAWLYQVYNRKPRNRCNDQLCIILFCLLTLSALWVTLILRNIQVILGRFQGISNSYTHHLTSEFLLSLLVFIVPSITMGATFSHLITQVSYQYVGKAYSLNMLGGAIAPVLFILVCLNTVGFQATLTMIALAYFLLLAISANKKTSVSPWLSIGILTGMLMLILPKDLYLVTPPAGWRTIAQREGLMGVVSVMEQESNGTTSPSPPCLRINQQFRMGAGGAFAEKRMGHIAMLLNINAKTAAFLGIGSGATLSAVLRYDLERIDAVEIVPEVIDLLPNFDPYNGSITTAANIQFIAADARRYIAATKKHYDIVLADLYHPARDGAAFLYSTNHFETIRQKLTTKGVFVQLLALYQFDEENLKTVVRSFLAVFKEVHSFIGAFNADTPALILVGTSSKGMLKIKRTAVMFKIVRLPKARIGVKY